MAFHGDKGGSRGGSRGGGSRGGRGGGFRGRGGNSGASRGRGRGRGGSRGGRGRPIFDSARVAERKERDEEESEKSEESEEEEDLQSEDVSSDEDEEETTVANPYAKLLQSLSADSGPSTKRRKLDIPETNNKMDGEDEPLNKEDSIDQVEEDEEGPETATDGILEDDEEEDVSDPFEARFADPDENELSRRLEALQQKQWSTTKSGSGKLPRAAVGVPGQLEGNASQQLAPISSFASLKLKQKLASVMAKQRPTFDETEMAIVPSLFNYRDILFCERTPANANSFRRLVSLHAINHIFKTRDRVIKNNARLAKEDNNDNLDLRDQGFTRPKVLMLLPTRESCVRMVNMINSLCEPEQQENRKRFDDSYVEMEERFSADKTEDFKETFGGNDDDLFRLGMKFTRKTVKFFSQFYNSDIIFASPLGLRTAIGPDKTGKVDSDFLSSIEIVIVDQCDALLMQNWEHVEFVFDHLNLQPKEAHGCDFSRVRSWYLDNNAKNFRQTIALSPFNTPELNTLFFNQSKNWTGKIKLAPYCPGVLESETPVHRFKQTFSRIEPTSFASDPDDRFTYFTTAIIPSLLRHSVRSAGTLIFIPSSFDFPRVRNYFSTNAAMSNISFGSIAEENTIQQDARARSHFMTGRHQVLLYTERAHHFRRYKLKGVKKVIMYGLPENPIFYREIVNGYMGRSRSELTLENGAGNARVIFSKWDALKLERIVGSDRVGKMMTDRGDTFEFL